VLFLFNHGLLYLSSVLSGTIITQEFSENSSNSFELALSPMVKGSFQQLFFMNLLLDVSLPSGKHCTSLAAVISQKVISDLSVGLRGSFPVVLLESCFLL
jgi:hypothetical protein